MQCLYVLYTGRVAILVHKSAFITSSRYSVLCLAKRISFHELLLPIDMSFSNIASRLGPNKK